MSLHQLVNGDDADSRFTATDLAGAGALAKATKVDDTARTLECTVDTFDGGDYTFGPVPYADVSGGAGVVAGDTVLLFVTTDGQPAAALKFT